ncbi:hypothetical protein EON67_05020, partial [archaeon]
MQGVLNEFKGVLEDATSRKVFHNYSFDFHELCNHGIETRGPLPKSTSGPLYKDAQITTPLPTGLCALASKPTTSVSHAWYTLRGSLFRMSHTRRASSRVSTIVTPAGGGTLAASEVRTVLLDSRQRGTRSGAPRIAARRPYIPDARNMDTHTGAGTTKRVRVHTGKRGTRVTWPRRASCDVARAQGGVVTTEEREGVQAYPLESSRFRFRTRHEFPSFRNGQPRARAPSHARRLVARRHTHLYARLRAHAHDRQPSTSTMSTVSRRHRREREEKALFVSACQSGDTELLRLLGASCGFRTKEVRRMVYPVLTGTHGMRAAIRASRLPLVDRQIMLDTARSFAFPDAMRWAPTVREKHVTELSLVLDYVFPGHQPAAGSVRREQGARAASRGERCYYQGAHDIASVLLLQLGAKQAAVVMDALVESHLAGFVRPTMACPDGLVQVTLYLLARLDAGLMAHFQAADMPLHFCLPWIITWFAHSIDNMDMCARFFDLFISTHPLMPVYVCVSLLLHYAPSLKATRADLTELYPIVSKLPTRIASPQEATRV